MADFRTAQRVRLFDGTNDIGFAQGNEFFVTIGDGSQELDLVTINSAYGATPVTLPIAGKYEATPTTYDDGDAVPLLTDANGKLVTVTTVTINYDYVDDSAFTVGTSRVAAIAGVATTDSVDANDVGALRMLTNRALVVTLEDAGGDGIAIDGSGNIAAILAANDGVDIGDVTINNAAGAAAVNIQDGGNSITVDGTVGISGSVTVVATDLDIRDLSHTTDSVAIGDGTETLNITAAGEAEIDIAAQSLTALKVSKDANANSETNPIYVQVVSGVVSGVEVHDYDLGATVAKDGTSNHDYTVTATKTLLLKRVIGSASGAGKYEVQVGPVASLATVAVQFGSGASPNVEFVFDPPIEIPDTSTGTVRVIRRNDDNTTMDMYSTIMGTEV